MRLRRLLPTGLLISATLVFAQAPGTLSPPDSILAEGVPAVPASVAEQVNRYTEFRGAGLVNWHPVKREMLISTRFGDTAQIHQVSMPGGDRYQLTFFPDRVAGASYQPTRGDYFILRKDIGGGEWFQYYRFDLASGDVTLLTDGKSRNLGANWNHQGDRIAYSSTRRNNKDTDVWVMNPADPKTDRMLLQLDGGGWGVADWSHDGSKFVLGEFLSANESYLWLVDVAAAQKTLITPKGGPVKIAYGGALFSKDDKGIWVTTDKDSEFQRLAYIDLASGKHTYYTDKWDVEEYALSDDGRTLAYTTNEDGISVLHLFDTATKKEKPAPKLPIGLIGGLEWHKNNRDLGFVINTARSTSDVYSLDVTTGKLDRWTRSETGGLNTASFSEPELIKWKSFDGMTISGFLYKPPAKFTGKRPVVVNIHGGPEGQSRPGFLGRGNYYLNELGVAVIFPNVRGSTGYGKTFLALDNGFKREDTYKDIDALLDWIKARPDLDGDRIMITGGSYGGHMTLAVATNYNDKIRCSLAVVPPSNLVSFLEHTEAYRRDLRRVEYGDERDPKMREYLTRIAPMTKASNINKPLFVVSGKNDPRVPLSEGEQMVATVRKNGSPVWFMVGKDEGHGFAKKKNQDYQFYSTIMFVKEFLLK